MFDAVCIMKLNIPGGGFEMFKRLIMKNALLRTLFSIRGNARACLWTEPMWGIPYNLCLPYVSLYMAALGLSPADIGMVASFGIVSQVIFSTLSGVITDKLGRRWTTVIFDTLSWSVPEFIWMASQNVNWFIAAALFNGAWRVTENSWDLLMMEDLDEKDVLPAVTLTQMLGLIAAFIAPLSKFAIDAFGLVPTMRVLYGITGTSMTIKFLLVHLFTRETRMGVQRMKETKNKRMITMLLECKDVYLRLVLNRRMLLTFGILAAHSLVTTLSGTYWSLLICGTMGVSEGNVVLFTTFKNLVTLLCAFTLVPRISLANIKKPLLAGFVGYIASLLLLLAASFGASVLPLLIVSCALEALSLAILSPTTRSLMLVSADTRERARVCGLVYATIALLTAVFPGIVGQLAEISLRIPFMVCMGLFVFAGILSVRLSRLNDPQ